MKKTTLFVLAFASLAAIFSCKKDEPVPAPQAPETAAKEIKFQANLFSFTKATDTAFEENDAIGVSIYTPEVYLNNAKYSYQNGSLVSEVANEWYDDENLVSNIVAYYPYQNGYAAAETVNFTVNADQTTPALYTASDLMIATTTSKPTEEAVALGFKHALSKVVVTIDNQLGEAISNVWFSDIYGSVSFSMADPSNLAATGSKGTIKGAMNNGAWSFIVAPQTEASPKLIVTTASKKQFTFILENTVTFTAGKVSTATVTLTAESIYTSFTPTITDWVADNELNFTQGENVELPVEKMCRLTVKVNKTIDWYDKYLYTWDASDNKLTGDWPGTKMEWLGEEGDYYMYYYDLPYSLNGTTINYIINGGNGSGQTTDLTVTLDGENTTVTVESSAKKA